MIGVTLSNSKKNESETMAEKLSDILTTFLQKTYIKRRKTTNRRFSSKSLKAPTYRGYTVFINLK